jgi:Ca-activated chloride channel family protein
MLITRWSVTASAIAAAVVPLATSQSPTFSARLEVVRVDALVTSGGRPVRGLTVADFEVFDDGVRQTLDFAGFEQSPLNVILAFDVSASLTASQLQNLRDAGAAALTVLQKDDRAALVTFSEAVSLESPLTIDVSAIESALARVEAHGSTALIDGVYAAVTVADAPQGRGLVIAFSDGSDTASWLPARQAIDAARRSDVVVYGVATGRYELKFLRDITDDTGGKLYQVESTADIRDRFLQILAEFRDRYVLSYTPSGVAKGGWHRLEVKVKGRRANVRARPGYLAD